MSVSKETLKQKERGFFLNKISHAKFLRSIESDGFTTAEVEFALEDEIEAVGHNKTYIAILRKQGEGSYHVDRIVKNNSEWELDWYENLEHEAWEDVTSELLTIGQPNAVSDVHAEFGTIGERSEDGADEERFVSELLSFEGVCEDMDCRDLQNGIFK